MLKLLCQTTDTTIMVDIERSKVTIRKSKKGLTASVEFCRDGRYEGRYSVKMLFMGERSWVLEEDGRRFQGFFGVRDEPHAKRILKEYLRASDEIGNQVELRSHMCRFAARSVLG